MRKIYTHENHMIVFNLKNLLAEAGIETLVVNEFASGGVGDLAAFDTWPELWLQDEAQFEQATAILQGIAKDAAGADWYCRGCQEKNDASFELCWRCGRSLE